MNINREYYRTARRTGIQSVIDQFIGHTHAEELGMLIADADFYELIERVTALRTFTGKACEAITWQEGLTTWISQITFARDELMEYNGVTVLPKYGECGMEFRREYARMFKWAIMQGPLTAGYAA